MVVGPENFSGLEARPAGWGGTLTPGAASHLDLPSKRLSLPRTPYPFKPSPKTPVCVNGERMALTANFVAMQTRLKRLWRFVCSTSGFSPRT